MTVTESELTDIVAAVWASLLAEEIVPVDPGEEPLAAIGAEITIDGAWSGTLRVHCSADVAREVTAEMLMLEPGAVDEGMVRDTLGELANIIGGNVKALLPSPSQLGLPTPSTAAGAPVAATSFAWRAGPFHVSLDEPADPDTDHPETAPGGTPVKIMIVDDSTAMRMIVRRQLRQAGLGDATVVEAVNGADALAKVTSSAPDLVLSDWNMPEMSGYELLVALRQQGEDVRFGFVTSEQTPAMRHQAFEAGASFLIGKPFTAQDFTAAIEGGGGVSAIGIGDAIEASELRRLLTDLLGRSVTVTPSDAAVTAVGAGWFVTDGGAPAAAITTDLAISAYLAGALSMLPPGRCEEAVGDGALDEVLAGNLGEVLNVLGVLFNRDGGPHVKLEGVVVGTPDGSATELAAGPAGRSFEVSVDGYGSGLVRVALA